MSNHEFAVGDQAKKVLSEALDNISMSISSTMGPGGRPFGFDKLGTDMRLTSSFSKDGLVTLRALRFNNPSWQAVLQYCRQAASHSVLTSGDGTSSTIVLANAVAKAVTEANVKYPQAFARQLEEDASRAVDVIKKEAIRSKRATELVALTSTNGDQELTDVVLSAIKHSSAIGSILVEKNPASSVRYKINRQDGYSNCAGYHYNSTFALSASQNAAASKPIEWKNPAILVFNGQLLIESQLDQILDAWNTLIGKTPRNLLIVAYEVSDGVTNKLMVLNRKMAQYGVSTFVVKPRLTAEINSGLQIMRDLASFCGVSDDRIIDGGNYEQVDDSFFGTCGKVKITPSNTMFLGRAPNHWVEARIMQNKSVMEEARSQFDREITTIRNAELAEGLVKVEVGGGLLPDLQERSDRFDDASKAAQSCMEHGALPGAGCSYIRAATLAGVHPALEKALRSIHETVMVNFGIDPNSHLVPLPGMTFFLDREHSERGNAIELGVLDACETVCAVIKNGVSLGVKIATIGGYCYRLQKDAADE